MKKLLLIFLIIMISPAIINAQFGIKAGINLSYFNGDNNIVTNSSSRIGFQGGFIYKIAIKDDRFSIQPELIVIQKGGLFKIKEWKVDANLNYIEMPVVAMYNIFGGLVNFHAGPQFSYLMKAKYEFEENNQTNIYEYTDLDNYDRFDIGFVIGTGVEFEIISIELRYSIGFLNVERTLTIDGQNYNPSSTNFNFQFNIAYFFEKDHN